MFHHFVVASTYLGFCLVLFVQLVRLSKHWELLRSFQAAFISLCFLWTLLRGIFWVLVEWPSFLGTAPVAVIYWVPRSVQFATWSLVVVFFGQGVHWRDWRFYRTQFLTAYALANVIVLGFVIAWTVVAASGTCGCTLPPRAWAVYGVVSGTVYSLLFIFASVFGYHLIVLFNSTKLPVSLTATSSRIIGSLIVSLFLATVFSHALFDIFIATQSHTPYFVGDTAPCEGVSGWTGLKLAVWELIPILVIVVYFRSVDEDDIDVGGDMHGVSAVVVAPGSKYTSAVAVSGQAGRRPGERDPLLRVGPGAGAGGPGTEGDSAMPVPVMALDVASSLGPRGPGHRGGAAGVGGRPGGGGGGDDLKTRVAKLFSNPRRYDSDGDDPDGGDGDPDPDAPHRNSRSDTGTGPSSYGSFCQLPHPSL